MQQIEQPDFRSTLNFLASNAESNITFTSIKVDVLTFMCIFLLILWIRISMLALQCFSIFSSINTQLLLLLRTTTISMARVNLPCRSNGSASINFLLLLAVSSFCYVESSKVASTHPKFIAPRRTLLQHFGSHPRRLPQSPPLPQSPSVPQSPPLPQSPSVPQSPPLPQSPPSDVPAPPAHSNATVIVFDAGNSDLLSINGESVSLTITPTAACRSRSSLAYPPGTTFTGRVKTPQGDTSGLVTSLYLSSMEGSGTQDEIDFEFLGNQKNAVQTNYYVNGVGGNEQMVQLSFDPSADFHTYTISYLSNTIIWYIDGVAVRQADQVAGKPFPVKSTYYYQSIWDASSINGGTWAGVATWANSPYVASYDNLSVA